MSVAIAALMAWLWLGLPASHVRDLVRLLLVSGAISLLLTLFGAWLLLHRTSGSLALKLGVACGIGPVVAGINTYFTADAMLIKQSDLGLLVLLLSFSGVVGMSFAFALARTLTARMSALARVAGRIGSDPGSAVAPEGTDEVGVLGRTLNDLARQLQAAEVRRQDLEAARRMLLAAVSHDLRTPLTSLRAVVEALDDGIVQDQVTVGRYLGSARQQVSQLESLIEDLFELSRLDAGVVELHHAVLSVPLLIEEAVQSWRVKAEQAGIRLELQVAADLPPVVVDGQRIGRVLLNLLGNALRYTSAGGSVTVEAQGAEDAVRISVRDTGVGIAVDDVPHIFERFYRGEKSRSRQHGGAGLGLAIARGLVLAHGGRIWAESAAGVGTTVSFTLPVASGVP
jgi:signal transduction histidine kinase